MKILIADAFDAKLPERLAVFGEVSSDMATLGEAEVLLIRSKTTVTQLMAIADAGQIMPPKSTWFEPKLRSGLVLHLFE